MKYLVVLNLLSSKTYYSASNGYVLPLSLNQVCKEQKRNQVLPYEQNSEVQRLHRRDSEKDHQDIVNPMKKVDQKENAQSSTQEWNPSAPGY